MSIFGRADGALYELLLRAQRERHASARGQKQLAFEIVQTYHSADVAKKNAR